MTLSGARMMMHARFAHYWYKLDTASRSRVTIEHGHANNHSNDYSSVAYWYQPERYKLIEDFRRSIEGG